MRGVHFVWKDTGKEDIGFIAQEVEEIFPQIVHNTRSGYKAISYEKMIQMGVPKEAVQRQKILDGKIPHPPPIPGIIQSTRKFDTVAKIKATDLQSVVLKKGKKTIHKKLKQEINNFEPPTVEELQTTLSKLKSIHNETL